MTTRTLALLLAAGLSAPALAQDKAAPEAAAVQAPAAPTSRIDVVFVLDTTGSMSGLIEGAKQKVWSIANAVATAKPRPTIRIGLVAYRDVGDEYVTKLTPLTDDLDAIYSDLMKFQAGGGGDGPESVNQALSDAVTKFDWAKEKAALRLVYLVGDAPPHMDYAQDTKYPATCEAAAKAGIIINTIQCGADSQTRPIWQEIARKAEGEFFAIEQSGGMAAIATPFDEDLARAGAELESTVVAYGTREEQAAQSEKMRFGATVAAAPAAAEAKADRAVYKASPAGRASLSGRKDLVQDAIDMKADPAVIPADQLPPELQAMTPAERAAHIQQKAKDRDAARARIAELDLKRQAFIKEKLAAVGTKDSFDALVLESLKRQSAKQGISFK